MESVLVEGCPMPKAFSKEAFQSARDYKPRADDVFVVTYPKCGTTWTGQIIQLIMKQGEPPAPTDFLTACPFLEMMGGKAAEFMKRPAPIKTHLPYHLVPMSPEAKYVYVTRNPKDCCVSYYHHQKNTPGGFTGTFNEFFEYFADGTIYYGDFFDHLLQWYSHREDPNVLFVTYEELKQDKEAAVLRIASFIDDAKYAEPLRQDPEKLQNVLKYSNFSYMKESINESMVGMFKMTKDEVRKSDLPEGLKQTLLMKPEGAEAKKGPAPNGGNFVRKGVIGDWKNYLTPEQSKRLDEKFAERLKGFKVGCVSEKRYEKLRFTAKAMTESIAALKNVTKSSKEWQIGVKSPVKKNGLEYMVVPGSKTEHILAYLPQYVQNSEDLPHLISRLQIEATYSSAVDRQLIEINEHNEDEGLELPEDFDHMMNNIQVSNEVREKLLKVRPTNLGAAKRIPGITPSALAALLYYVRRQKNIL